MKFLFLTLLLLNTRWPAAAQKRLNPKLKQELDSIAEIDRQWRRMLFAPRFRRRPDSLAVALGVTKESLGTYVVRRMQQADSTNLLRVRTIIKQYGYPGKSLVGEPTNDAAWHVIQHSDDIDRYLPAIKTAAKHGELPFFLYAQMLDRQLMRDGKEQLYGTQGMGYSITNPATGRREPQPPFIWPIKDAVGVNARRRKAGFPDTVEQTAAKLGIAYRVLTLKDVAQMPKE